MPLLSLRISVCGPALRPGLELGSKRIGDDTTAIVSTGRLFRHGTHIPPRSAAVDASWVLLICRSGELGGPLVPVVCVLLIWRSGDETRPVLPLAVMDGLDAN